jgi:hypothetical protein
MAELEALATVNLVLPNDFLITLNFHQLVERVRPS